MSVKCLPSFFIVLIFFVPSLSIADIWPESSFTLAASIKRINCSWPCDECRHAQLNVQRMEFIRERVLLQWSAKFDQCDFIQFLLFKIKQKLLLPKIKQNLCNNLVNATFKKQFSLQYCILCTFITLKILMGTICIKKNIYIYIYIYIYIHINYILIIYLTNRERKEEKKGREGKCLYKYIKIYVLKLDYFIFYVNI